jgi:hypothetical protein
MNIHHLTAAGLLFDEWHTHVPPHRITYARPSASHTREKSDPRNPFFACCVCTAAAAGVAAGDLGCCGVPGVPAAAAAAAASLDALDGLPRLAGVFTALAAFASLEGVAAAFLVAAGDFLAFRALLWHACMLGIVKSI